MKTIALTILLLLTAQVTNAQTLIADQVSLSFFSETPLENISATSKQGVSAIDSETQSIYFKVAIQTFEFKKPLMQEHFNEKYLESDRYPYAEFKGNIQEPIDFDKKGTSTVTANGELSIHNVTKSYTVQAQLQINDKGLTAEATFPVSLKDHDIKIPRLVIKNIAEVVEVTVVAHYKVPTN